MMRLLILLFAALCATAILEDGNLKHVGSQMFRVTPTNVHQVRYLHGISKTGQYDFWSQPNAVGKSVDILATKWMIPVLKETLKMAKIDFEIRIHDMYQAIKMSQIENEIALAKFRAQRTEGEKAIDWTAYHDYDEIMEWVNSLPGTYPNLVTVTDAGLSYEGREMKLIKVSTGGSGKPAIFTDAGIHAREWIAPATLTYILNELLTNSAAYQSVLDTVDFYFMADINPDGYSYTWDAQGDRLWRKTRSPNSGSACIGTDPNRNWDFHWLESGASTLPCAETYAGPEAFSEVECRNVRDQMLAVAPDTKLYLTFHSYGQYLLYPWGYASVDPPDVAELASLANDAADALRAVYGTVYSVGGSGTILYAAAGASDDYAKGVGNIKFSYTMELRPDQNGAAGFQLPPAQIVQVGQETLEAYKVFMNHISDTYGKK